MQGCHQEQEERGQTQGWRWGRLQHGAKIQPGNGVAAGLRTCTPMAQLRLRLDLVPRLDPKWSPWTHKQRVQARGLRYQFIHLLNLVHLLTFQLLNVLKFLKCLWICREMSLDFFFFLKWMWRILKKKSNVPGFLILFLFIFFVLKHSLD